jgi:hypothetical protein
MSKEAKLIIYNIVTGKHIKEIPLNFWFSFAEPLEEDKTFCMEVPEYQLQEGEAYSIEIPLEAVLEQIKRTMMKK